MYTNANKNAESMDPMWLINKAFLNFKTSYQVSCLPPVRKQVLAELGDTRTAVLISFHVQKLFCNIVLNVCMWVILGKLYVVKHNCIT